MTKKYKRHCSTKRLAKTNRKFKTKRRYSRHKKQHAGMPKDQVKNLLFVLKKGTQTALQKIKDRAPGFVEKITDTARSERERINNLAEQFVFKTPPPKDFNYTTFNEWSLQPMPEIKSFILSKIYVFLIRTTTKKLSKKILDNLLGVSDSEEAEKNQKKYKSIFDAAEANKARMKNIGDEDIQKVIANIKAPKFTPMQLEHLADNITNKPEDQAIDTEFKKDEVKKILEAIYEDLKEIDKIEEKTDIKLDPDDEVFHYETIFDEEEEEEKNRGGGRRKSRFHKKSSSRRRSR